MEPTDHHPSNIPLRRAVHITHTLLKHRIDVVFEHLGLSDALPPALRIAARVLGPVLGRRTAQTESGRALRAALESLGPVFVKFGQLLSTRRDLLPADVADELAHLQDRVAPFPGELARARVEQSLGESVAVHFAHFDTTPLASASVAQVHAATLNDGTAVVVKIVRPDIAETIAADLKLLATLAAQLENRSEEARRLHLTEVVADYRRTIFNELDMRSEAANTIRLRQNFAGSDLLYVPRIYKQFTRRDMLVMERINGVCLAELHTLRALNVDLKRLAERGVEVFFTQVFVDNFFHADMHPGNIFVDVSDPADPSYIALDCAIVGSLTEADQNYLARNLMAFFTQDYREVVRLHLQSGWIPADTDAAEFEAVIERLCTPIFEKPLAEISFAEFLVELFQTAQRFNMEIQPQLVLLQKTLLYVEGVGRQLYPQLDLWTTAKPFMETWMRDRLGPLGAIRTLSEQAPFWLEELPRLPERMLATQQSLAQMQAMNQRQARRLSLLEHSVARVRQNSRQRRIGGIALLILATGLLWPELTRTWQSGDWLTSAGVLLAAAGSYLLLRG